MVDFKSTLINLHERFPDYDLDTIIAIIDSIVEVPTFHYTQGIRDNKIYYDDSSLNCKPKIRNLDKEYTTEKF